jgi:hypothetical protein
MTGPSVLKPRGSREVSPKSLIPWPDTRVYVTCGGWEAATIRRAMEEGKVYKFQSAGDTALFEREPDPQPRGC